MKLWALLFFALPILGFIYVSWHVWVILPLPTAVKWGVMALFTCAIGCLFFNFIVGLNNVPMTLARILYKVGTSSLFVLLYAVIIFLLLDLGQALGLVSREFLRSSVAGSIAIFTSLLGLFVYGNINYNHKRAQRFDLKAQQPLSSPLKVVMMSDLHLGYHNTRKDLAKWIDKINAEKPDLILIAGDIVDISTRPLEYEDMAAELRRLDAPVYTIPGNHEYYAGINKCEDFFRKADIHLLKDSSFVFRNEITIIGRDDRSNAGRKSIAELARTAPKAKYTILLDHQPYNLERAEKAGINFQFSGHTHYGQVWPINWIEDMIYEDAYGHLIKGNTRYYVSSGIGIWGGKFRIGTCSEYAVTQIK